MRTAIDWYRTGGPVMHLILLAALAGAVLFVERFWVIVVRSRINGRAFIEQLVPLVRSDKIEDAIKLCARSKAVLPDMGLIILRGRTRDEADLRTVAHAATLAVVPRVTRRLRYLVALASASILLGVLGTIYAAQAALQAAAAFGVTDRGAQLAAGFATALGPLGLGIAVAIPLGLAHAYLASQSEMIAEQAEELSVRLINALIDRPDVRLGHR